MRYLETDCSSIRSALLPAIDALDQYWWYLDGTSLSVSSAFLHRHRNSGYSSAEIEQYHAQCVAEYVTEIEGSSVGKPGFFSQLSDCIDLNWSIYFAIDAEDLPVPTLTDLARRRHEYFGSLQALPSDVQLVVCDIDGGQQYFAFRDKLLFDAVRWHLEKTSWCRVLDEWMRY